MGFRIELRAKSNFKSNARGKLRQTIFFWRNPHGLSTLERYALTPVAQVKPNKYTIKQRPLQSSKGTVSY